MALPRVGDFQRSMSMSLPTSPNRLENLQQPNPSVNAGPSGPGSANPQPPQVVQPDPAINEVVRNGVGPDLQPGNGQGAHFAANHEVGPGRDWDLNSAEGMIDTAQKAVANIKTTIAGRQGLDDFDKVVTDTVARTVAAHPENVGAVEALATALTEFKTLIREVQSARAALTAAVKDGSGVKDPREALAGILKTLRVFRYDMQVQLARYGHEAGRMDVYESALREIQHAFTFKVGSKVGEDFPKLARLEHRLADKFAEIRDKLRAMDPAVRPTMPKGIWIGDVAGKALELSHLTNDRIRDFQDADGATCVLREIVGPIAEKGGSRKVEFNVGVGALIGLGFSSAFTAGVRAGARFRVVGEISRGGRSRSRSASPAASRPRAASRRARIPSSCPAPAPRRRAPSGGRSRTSPRAPTGRSRTSSSTPAATSSPPRARSAARSGAASSRSGAPSARSARSSSAGSAARAARSSRASGSICRRSRRAAWPAPSTGSSPGAPTR